MNKENFKLIVNSFKPDNIYVNSLDYVLVLIPSFSSGLDFITNKSIINSGTVANYFGSKIWITYPESDVNRNFIKIAEGNSNDFNEIRWSLPICLDWHSNKIQRMWDLKAFW